MPYRRLPHRRLIPLVCAPLAIAALSVSMPGRGEAQDFPRIDLDFTVEHLLEVTMDSRFASVPAAAVDYDRGVWTGAMTAGWQSAGSKGLDIEGSLIAGTIGLGFAPGRGIELTGFYDQASFSGTEREHVLRTVWSRDVPLDLPQRAQISNPTGDVSSWGAGVAYVRQLGENARGRRWTWRVGVLYDQLEVKDVQMRYRLVSGAFEGTEGQVDYSAKYSYTTPWAEGEIRWALGGGWEIAPHVSAFYPLPRRGFAGRITGPGFDVAGDSGDLGTKPMGDPYVGFGVRLDSRRSGLGIDLGATAFQAFAEGLVHEGIETSILVLVSWQPPRR